MDPVKRGMPPVTKAEIKTGLERLGLATRNAVGVHSSLSRFGYVAGGADAVIDAILETVGTEGTVVMPTFSTNRIMMDLLPEEKAAGASYLCRVLPYDPVETPCWTGAIPETFRKRPGVVRSLHPLFSVVAAGAHAQEIVDAGREHSLSSWRRLMDLGGFILLVGVGLEVCTAMHLAEERVALPRRLRDEVTPPSWSTKKYPEGEWDWDFGPYPEFAKMERPCLEREILVTAMIGQATLRFGRLKDLVDLYDLWLREDPYRFYVT